ncbi:uncharacterized protein LOC130901443 [Diorhabda carinulata]|uniref:uncharacterized protein LOC130901443 n=1 Tax=Diorhabda carinulata TaxID=1163345 RepID=UPI0025A12328|nr:uncharacterized protein LOC130901443 [Diorhabda carinulata]
MSAVTILCILSAFAVMTFGLPRRRDIYAEESPPGYVVGGYLKKPIANHDYLPSMSTFVTKDVVATNTFAGIPQDTAWDTNTKEDYTERDPQNIPINTPELAIEENASSDSSSTTGVENNDGNNREVRKKGRKPSKPQEDEDDDTPWWFTKGGGPSFTSFFPINISGGVRRRSGGPMDENDTPSGSATAIANSFSTGRGGVATSHATSFGDPYLASLFLKHGMYDLKGDGHRKGSTTY